MAGGPGLGFGFHLPGFSAPLEPAFDGRHRDAEDLGNLPSWHPAIYGFEHLEPQVFGVRFHIHEFRSGSIDMQAAVGHHFVHCVPVRTSPVAVRVAVRFTAEHRRRGVADKEAMGRYPCSSWATAASRAR